MEHDYETGETVGYIKKQPVWAFCLLCFCTFGLYTIYWFYKNWAFFKHVYNWDIFPVWRALFGVFFVHSLMDCINDLAIEKGHPGIHSNIYATGFVILAITQRVLDQLLPAPLVVFALFIPPFLFLIPSVQQLNYIYEQAHSNQYRPVFSAGETIALLLGGLLLVMAVIGLSMGNS